MSSGKIDAYVPNDMKHILTVSTEFHIYCQKHLHILFRAVEDMLTNI